MLLQALLGTSDSCSIVLHPNTLAKLGNAPSCYFSSPSNLIVQFGSSAIILPAGSASPDVVTLLPGAIALAAGNSYNATGSVVLQGPDAQLQLPPTPILVAPEQVWPIHNLQSESRVAAMDSQADRIVRELDTVPKKQKGIQTMFNPHALNPWLNFLFRKIMSTIIHIS